MAMNFPDSPTLNQVFIVGNRRWVWTGVAWDIVQTGSGNIDGGKSNSVYGGTTNVVAGNASSF